MNEIINFLYQIKKTWAQRKEQKKSAYRYYNFWKIDEPESVWFSQFIESRNLNPQGKKINFISVFGSPHTYLLLRSPKFFFTGEDLKSNTFPHWKRFKNNLLGKVDLSLGFENVENEHYLRLPLWIISLIDPTADLDEIKEMINDINSISLRNNERNKFACQISRHDVNGIREKIINLLNTVAPVDCAGNFMNNTDLLRRRYNDDKIEFLKNYKFNICPENSDSEGYVTEKIIDAFKAGCIPVYWGKNNFKGQNIFNEKAILFYDEETNGVELKKQVHKIWTDENAYKQFIAQPPFLPDAAEKIWGILNELEKKFLSVIEKY